MTPSELPKLTGEIVSTFTFFFVQRLNETFHLPWPKILGRQVERLQAREPRQRPNQVEAQVLVSRSPSSRAKKKQLTRTSRMDWLHSNARAASSAYFRLGIADEDLEEEATPLLLIPILLRLGFVRQLSFWCHQALRVRKNGGGTSREAEPIDRAWLP